MSNTESSRRPGRMRRLSPRTWRWGQRVGLGLTLVGLVAMVATLIRLPRFVSLGPIIPTSAKGLHEAHSDNGLDFHVVGQLLAQGMASQAHSFDASGEMHLVATDPTILRTRRGPDGEKVARTSSLVVRRPSKGTSGLLLVPGCTNRPRNHTGEVAQCVDPTIVDLLDGRQRLFWVESHQRVDPAFTDSENQFRSAISDGTGRWIAEDGVRFSAPTAADPDVIHLPDGRWRMYYTSGRVEDEETGNFSPAILSATSTDGAHFKRDEGVRSHRCSASASMVLASGQVRLYCHTRDVFTNADVGTDPSAYIVSLISDDGLHFTREPGVRLGTTPAGWGRLIGAAAPSIRPHPDGGISMVFTTVVEPPFPWNWTYLKGQEAVLEDIMSDLEGRAEMGPGTPLGSLQE